MVIVLFTYQMHQGVRTKIGTGTQAREFNSFRFVCRDTETIYLRDVQKYKNILQKIIYYYLEIPNLCSQSPKRVNHNKRVEQKFGLY